MGRGAVAIRPLLRGRNATVLRQWVGTSKVGYFGHARAICDDSPIEQICYGDHTHSGPRLDGTKSRMGAECTLEGLEYVVRTWTREDMGLVTYPSL